MSTTRLWLIRHGEPAEEARGLCYGSLDFGLSERGRAQMARVAEYLKDEPIAAIYSSPRARAVESAEILVERISREHAQVALPDGRGCEREVVPLPDGRGSEREVVPLPDGRGSEREVVPLPDGRGSEREKVPLPDGRGSERREVSTRHAGEGLLKNRADVSPLAGHGPAPQDASTVAGHVIPDLREIDFGDFEGLTYDEIALRYPEQYREWMEMPTEIRFPSGECFSEMRSRVLEAFDAIEREWRGRTVAIVSHGGVNRILIAWALQIPDQYLFRVAQDFAAVNLLTMEDGTPSVQSLNHRVT